MHHRRLRSLRGLAPFLAFSLAIAGMTPVWARAPDGDFESLIAQADEHVSEARHADATQAYADAFEAMPDELRTSGVGEFVALAAAKAALQAHAEQGDVASLERARTVLEEFVAQAADPTEARTKLEEIVALIPEPEPEPEPEPQPEPRPVPVPVVDEGKSGPSRGVGIGLLVGGGVSLLAGVGLVVTGVRQVPWYEDRLAEAGWDPQSSEYDVELANAERVRTIDLGIGAALGGIGLGLGIAGAVILARAGKKPPGTVAFGADVTRRRAMFGARWRF